MNRRHMMASLGVAVATPALLSLTTAEAADANSEQKQWQAHSLAISSLSLLASRAAIEQAVDQRVIQFAKWEAAEQDAYGAVLHAMVAGNLKDGADQDPLKPPTNDQAMKALTDDDRDALSDLKKKSGSMFDQAYVQAELSGHKKLLKLQTTYLGKGKNPTALFFARIAEPYIKQHIDQLSDLGPKKA